MSQYNLNRAINKEIEFKGLRAQYISYLAVGLLVLLLLFTALIIVGVPALLCLLLIVTSGSGLFWWVFHANKKYGVHGILKKAAYRKTPAFIRCRRHLPLSQLKTKG